MLTTTRDQVELLRSDNVVSAAAVAEGRDFAGLSVIPRGVDTVLPAYMSRFRKTGLYAPKSFA
jgi:NADH dehydrogenase